MCKAGKEDEDEEEDDWEDEDADGEEDIQLRGQTLSDLIDSMAAEFNGDYTLCIYLYESTDKVRVSNILVLKGFVTVCYGNR